MKGQNPKGSEETESDKDGDPFRDAGRALRSVDGQPSSRREVQNENADKHIDDLVGNRNSKADGEGRHNQHGNNKQGSGPSVEAPALGRKCCHGPRDEADRPCADVKNEGRNCDFVKQKFGA